MNFPAGILRCMQQPNFGKGVHLSIRNKNPEVWIDFILAPLIIFFNMYSPYFASGIIFSLDEGQHLACINELLRGSILFRDIYTMHGPFLEYIPYWLMKLFGVNFAVLRGFYMFGNILSLLLAFFLLRVLVSNSILKYCALFLILRFSIDVMEWIPRWGGIRWAPGFVALLLLYYWLRDGKSRFLSLAGLACGIGLLISQEIGLTAAFSVAVGIFLNSLEYRKDGRFARLLSRNCSFFSMGFGLVVFPFVAYLILHGTFLEYLRIQFIDTLFLLTKRIPYGAPIVSVKDLLSPSGDMPLSASRSLALYIMVFVISGIFVWAIFNYRRKPLHRMIFLISLVAYNAISLKAATRAITGPQFNFILLIDFITLAMFLDILVESDGESISERNGVSDRRHYLRGAMLKRFVTISTLLVTILLFRASHIDLKWRFMYLWGFSSHPQIRAGVEMNADIIPRAKGARITATEARDINDVVRFLKKNTDVNERIFTFPSEGHINFLADRKSASRFAIAIYSKVRNEYMEEVIRDLKADQTKYIVHRPDDYEIRGIPNEQRLEPLWKYIQAKYVILKRYGSMNILVRADTAVSRGK
jgi:hypothetical protein